MTIISSLIAAIVAIILVIIASNTFAYQDDNNCILFYNENKDILKDDIRYYVDTIDDYLFPNSSFIYSDVLTENYDFLTNFAIDYIINNKTHYSDKIIKLDSYDYYDVHYNKKTTNEYIDKVEIKPDAIP